ncbi:MAG: single-stranded-DNA-specific exonuclease RecJ [Oscillospiraceae bacterium]|nr:single-stranded-DNA-specific exonuclease RecJ [Oscillospiraceae bacterium]
MKYSVWNVPKPQPEQTAGLISAGVSPLSAAVLVSRGYDTPEKARSFLASGQGVLHDPMELPDMDLAAARVRQAIKNGETIAVYGDYDVDGITSTCLLTDFLEKSGANVIWYIPARLEEGYGLNETAIRGLKTQGVKLIVTVDCGITAVAEAELCAALGIDLVITDHHECKEELPRAAAVVNPHRKDSAYPFQQLAGVGVAFKLAAAVSGDQMAVFREYCDLVSLGTVADVMPLVDENRVLVTGGIRMMQRTRRPGLLALLKECQLTPASITSSTIGYTLAPRINAAGRMGKVELAAELFMTKDPDTAAVLADALCRLNRQRQAIEAAIYADVAAMLDGVRQPDAIVLAGETWHQGVVGIVASRLAEDYGCPVFLVCLSGDSGKASSRSYGGFPLFSTLEKLEGLLESFGGHELAAGFTIRKENIPEFRRQVTKLAAAYREAHPEGAALELDCAVSPELLTTANVTALDRLEPFGASFPRPLLYLEGMQVQQLMEVGGGKHLKLRLQRDGWVLDGIFFSTTACKAAVALGDTVEVAFTPQINEFRGIRSVQLNITDIRPVESERVRIQREQMIYHRFRQNAISHMEALALIPPRDEFAVVWRYIRDNSDGGCLTDEFFTLTRKISRSAGVDLGPARTRVCLDVMEERGLIELDAGPRSIYIKLIPSAGKVDLQSSAILLGLRNHREGEH